MKSFLNSITSPKLTELENALESKTNTALTGLTDSMAAFVASKISSSTPVKKGRKVLVVSANDLSAGKFCEDAQQMTGGGAVLIPGGEIQLTRGASSQETEWRRLDGMTRIASGEVTLAVTSVDALMQKMSDPEIFRQSIINVKPGDILSPEKLISRLSSMGYERVEMVEGKGQCARRGDIIDVYPPCSVQGIRMEFFDNEVDSLRTFDCISQRSQDKIDSVSIGPAAEILLTSDDYPLACERMKAAITSRDSVSMPSPLFSSLPPLPEDEDSDQEFFDKAVSPKQRERARTEEKNAEIQRKTSFLQSDAELLGQGIPFKRIRAWLTVITEKQFTLLDFFRPDVVLLINPPSLQERCSEHLQGFSEELSSAMERGDAVQSQQDLLMDWEAIAGILSHTTVLTSSEMLHGQGMIPIKNAIDFGACGSQSYHSQVKQLASDCDKWRHEGFSVVLLSGGVARGKRLEQSMAELQSPATFFEEMHNLIRSSTVILPLSLTHGFIWREAGLIVVADTDIYGSGYRKAKSRKNSGEKIASFTDLNIGDYVVHEDHGVGIYGGTVHMQSEGTFRDYLLISYLGEDKLYVPIEQLERVQKYIGNPNQPPKLNKLGGGEWEKQKAKVKEGIKKLAFDLVKLYARRSQETGYAFPPDGPWQREFEDQFPYELTPDQEQSVKEITADMESSRNMDRLLCGDVGYGKTEVSLRAAFKAVYGGKQVAILAPTTILAQQHYNTVLKRFANFPVESDVISRFRTPKEIKDVLERLSCGKIDIIVGTHRLLGKDVKFKNLGLLIVDEEQRFGVGHKEIIKNMKSQMDVLTLSATPIPRTLHMSMVGIRDMSLLETPPEDRLPVQTHVVDYSDAVIRDAILRELSRHGQVYFLYNRVRSIEEFYTRLHALVPEARIGVAHGQMKEHGLEDVMMDFYSGAYDVLLCTTIIESGLDVPNANTLIVFDADHFGLSQLYQLRGRVGRSSRQAYAYFTVRPDKNLSETAQQRLNAIREFTEFGAGFRIAMRDLEIRGAGNLLGPEQHGHLTTVGYDMYCKLMEETLSEVKGESMASAELSTRIDMKVDAYLPQDYIADEKQRMEMYKRIAEISSDIDREDIIDELVDRFGDMPPAVTSLLDIAQLRAISNRLGASQVTYHKPVLSLVLDQRYMPDPAILMQAMIDTDSRLNFSHRKPTALQLTEVRLDEAGMLEEGVRVLKKLDEKVQKMVKQKSESSESKHIHG